MIRQVMEFDELIRSAAGFLFSAYLPGTADTPLFFWTLRFLLSEQMFGIRKCTSPSFLGRAYLRLEV